MKFAVEPSFVSCINASLGVLMTLAAPTEMKQSVGGTRPKGVLERLAEIVLCMHLDCGRIGCRETI